MRAFDGPTTRKGRRRARRSPPATADSPSGAVDDGEDDGENDDAVDNNGVNSGESRVSRGDCVDCDCERDGETKTGSRGEEETPNVPRGELRNIALRCLPPRSLDSLTYLRNV